MPFQLSGIQHIDGVSPMKLAVTFPFGIMIAELIIGWLQMGYERGKHLAGRHRSWCAEQLGPVRIQVHEGLRHHLDAVSSDLKVLGAGGAALLVIGCSLLWLGIASPPRGSTWKRPQSVSVTPP